MNRLVFLKQVRANTLPIIITISCLVLVIVAGVWLLSHRGAPESIPAPPTKILKTKTSRPENVITHIPEVILNIENHPKIAIIIDDLGYQWRNGLRAIHLKGEFTLAILPFSPFATKLAAAADIENKELMLHAPMEPISHHTWKGGLSQEMSEKDIRSTLNEMLKQLPTVKGVNNHMGSAFTQSADGMSWIMDEVAAKKLYFVDSVTTANSQAYIKAVEFDVPSAKRDIFLDNERTSEAITHQLTKLLDLAKKNGTAIGIGHPYPETLTVLEAIKPILEQHKIELIQVSHLLEHINHGK